LALALETRALTRRFDFGGGVGPLDLAVPRGSLFGFVGPNGAGKTTTIRLLLGLIRAQSGQILIDGSVADRQSRSKLSALIESPSLYGHLSGYDNLDVTRRLLDKPRASIDAALERVDLRAAAKQRAGEYSLGMRQRLGLALCLLGDPQILILDEPANGLDPQGIADLRTLLRRLVTEDGLTLLMSSHLLSEVEQVATHVGVLHRGELRFQGDIGELRQRARPTVRIHCSRPDAAAALLRERGIPARLVDGRLAIDADIAAHTVNRGLVEAGFEVYALDSVRPNLEDLFFGLTQESRP
jgi:ABC-2 type transport system ATP-binding protein